MIKAGGASSANPTESDKASCRSSPVLTRRVHYLAGFDPRGGRYYHKLYRDEAAKQAVHSGARLRVGERRRLCPGISAWNITGDWNGQTVETQYQFMEWDDIVRNHWVRSPLKLFLQSLPLYLNYWRIGAFKNVRRASRLAFYTCVYPPFYFFAICALTLVVALFGAAFYGLKGGGMVILAITALAACATLMIGLRLAERIGVLWLLRSSIFTMRWGEGRMPEIEEVDQKATQIADHILEQQRANPVDEVLIVAHSSGAMLAVSVVARLLEKTESPGDLGKISLLTLGQCISYLSAMPTAKKFIRELEVIARDSRIPWTDASAPPDLLSFFKVDPIKTCGLATQLEHRPRQIVVRFFRMFPEPTYKKLRRNKVRLHFQYLMASELVVNYDFFRITAGPQSFHQYVEAY